MIVPWENIADDTLQRLLEEYVSRDGTDYGEVEVPLATRVGQVRRALQQRQLAIWFDEASEATTLLPRDQALAAERAVL